MHFNIKNKIFIYLLAMPSLAIILGGFALYIVEQRVEEPSIKNIGDAYWLAVTTITTVGYGEIYPETLEGRIVSGVLLFVGILTIFGFLTTIGAKIIEPMLEVKNRKQENSGNNQKDDYSTELSSDVRSNKNTNPNHMGNNATKAKDWSIKQIDNLAELDNEEFGHLISILISQYYSAKSKQ